MTPLQRFEAKYRRDPSGCWLWTAATSQTDTGRRGRFWLGGAVQWAPRAAYMLYVGDPSSLLVCHTCDNGLCVNPAHLFLGSDADNNQDKSRKGRAYRASRVVTHCKRGHEYTAENTKTFTLRTGYTSRQCRTCLRAYSTAYNAGRRAGG